MLIVWALLYKLYTYQFALKIHKIEATLFYVIVDLKPPSRHTYRRYCYWVMFTIVLWSARVNSSFLSIGYLHSLHIAYLTEIVKHHAQYSLKFILKEPIFVYAPELFEELCFWKTHVTWHLTKCFVLQKLFPPNLNFQTFRSV